MCSLESGYGSFQRCVNLGVWKQWAGIALGKGKPFPDKLHAWGVTTHHDLTIEIYDQVTL